MIICRPKLLNSPGVNINYFFTELNIDQARPSSSQMTSDEGGASTSSCTGTAPRNVFTLLRESQSSKTKRNIDDAISYSNSTAKMPKIEKFVTKTSTEEKNLLDKELARMIYATNTPFTFAEHREFRKFVQMLRPGYKPPSRLDVGGPLLEKVYDEDIEKCKKQLSGRSVTLDIDGWSNVHNEPVICASLIVDKKSYLVKTVDTSGKPHTADYLAELTQDVIKESANRFNVKVKSFVTDNAANMVAMKQKLNRSEDEDISSVVTYGCSAHIGNLLAKDLDNSAARNHVVQIVKHIRNKHAASAAFKEAGGNKLVYPAETRWNSVSDCLESYIKQWPILASLTLDDKDIMAKTMNIGIKNQAQDLYKRLKLVAIAVDKLQSNGCYLSEAVHIWKVLQTELSDVLPSDLKQKVKNRYNMAITPWHLVAFSLDPNMIQPEVSRM